MPTWDGYNYFMFMQLLISQSIVQYVIKEQAYIHIYWMNVFPVKTEKVQKFWI